MAITIVQQPPAYAFGGAPMVYGLDSTAYASAGFKYVADVYIWTGSSASVPAYYNYRLTRRPDPVSGRYGYFDIRNLVESFLSATNIQHDDAAAQNNIASVVNVQVKFREYTTSAGTGSVSATSSTIKAYDGWTEFAEGLNQDVVTDTEGILTSMPQSPVGIPIQENQAMTIGVMLGAEAPPDRIRITYSDGSDSVISFASLSITGGTNSSNWMWYVPVGIANLNEYAAYIVDEYEARVLADGGTYEVNTCLAAFISNPPSSVSNLQWYTVEFLADTTVLRTYRFEVQCEPRYEPLTLAFQNKYGAWDYLLVQKKSVESIRAERETYSANVVTRQSGVASMPAYAAQKQYFNTQAQEQLVVNTGFIPDQMNEMIKQMMVSPVLQIVEQEASVVLTDSQITYKTSVNDFLTQYTFTLDYANPLKNKAWL